MINVKVNYLNDQIDIGNKAYVKLFTKFLSVNDNIVMSCNLR